MQPQLIAGRYHVLRAIGRGGMGTVWLCRDEVLGRQVAVKQIGALAGDTASETKRAMREARSAAALNHPNAVAVYDVVTHESRPWLVMEYVEGQTLADEISRDGQLSPQRVADIGAQLAGALARAHERGIVHRDIKPGNVLIDKAGRPKISDFGIARGHGDEQLTQIGFITGTPGFLSPELARGADPHPASDVWALGATLYSAVEGQPPYAPRSNPIALLRAIAIERPRPMTHAGALGPAIDAMMHEDPACRWDMATCARRLGAIARAGAPAVPRRVDPSVTRVIPAPLRESTQTLEPTQRLEAVAPPVSLAAAAVATAVPAEPPVTTRSAPSKPAVVEQVAAASASANPAVVEPVTAGSVPAKAPVVDPVTKATVVPRRPVVGAPAVRVPVARTPVTKAPMASAALGKRPESAGLREVQGSDPVPPLNVWGSGRRSKPILLGALLVAVLGVTFLFSPLSDQGNTTAAPGTTRSTAPVKPAPTSAPLASARPSPTSSAPMSTTVPPAANANVELEDFVRSYYAAVTQNRDATWDQLSPTMQTFARGRSGYDGWWTTIRNVKVTMVQANASADSAVATLTFTSMGGATSTENHAFRFVRSGGGYLIESDRLVR